MAARGAIAPREAMRLALQQARRGLGRTFPSPSVGAVVFRGRELLGRGCTRPPGGPHAEVVALSAAARRFGDRAIRGASLATTLEPCCFTGRTGPCTTAIIESGLARVYVGCRDPHPRVSGRGIRQLRSAGVDVELGLLEAECREQHRGFFSLCEGGRPFVSLKLASTLDGRIATKAGESRWITSAPARALVHRMRARVDAVMVGSATARIDDPELSARRGDRVLHRPVRVLVDSKLSVPLDRKLYALEAGERTWVLCGARAPGRAARAAAGARLLDVPVRAGHVDLSAALAALGGEGLTTLLVEGGGGLAAALLREHLVDEIHWMMAPRLLGADGRPALGPLGVEKLAEAASLEAVRIRRVGPDLYLRAKLGRRRT